MPPSVLSKTHQVAAMGGEWVGENVFLGPQLSAGRPVVMPQARQRGQATKRAIDLAVAVPAAVLTAPLVFVLAIGSAISFRASPFFAQTRVGQHGQSFRCIKIRSLPTHAPQDADRPTIERHLHNAWGRALRRTRLDELPQFWCVVIGTMSLVGPRPVIPEHAASFDQDFVSERCSVRPGLTGLWQLSSASHRPIGEHPEYDLRYIKTRTWRLDLWVMAKTLPVIVTGGRLELSDIPRWTGALDAAETL